MSRELSSAAAIEEAAALWLIRREDADWTEESAAELDRWLDLSMAHRAAFWRLEHGWREADRVVALGTTPARRWRWLSPIRGRRVLTPSRRAAVALVAVSVAIMMVLGHGHFTKPVLPSTIYQTPVGGNQTLDLADGSRIELNTATRVRAAVDSTAREVWLEDGEAFFDIAHREGRRFVVHAGPRDITVLGTRFSVRRKGDAVTVAVVAGRVRVDDPRTSDHVSAATVSSGDVATTELGSTVVQASGTLDVEAITAWRKRLIVFNDTALSDAVAEFNRYSTRPILIATPALGRQRIGGTFRNDDGAGFVALLNRGYGVRVAERPDAIVLSQ